jgi:hypothetical protein
MCQKAGEACQRALMLLLFSYMGDVAQDVQGSDLHQHVWPARLRRAWNQSLTRGQLQAAAKPQNVHLVSTCSCVPEAYLP